jgi:hypothetical protein
MSLLANVGITYFIDLYLADNPVLKYFYNQMYRNFNPDVTGYTLLFMVPPEFSAKEYNQGQQLKDGDIVNSVLSTVGLAPQTITSLMDFSKAYPFMATEFTPPQTQVQNSQVQTRTGALSYASDIHETESVTINFLESNPLTIYKFHLLWVEYIRELLKGTIQPDDKYIDSKNADYFGAQDYLASLYIVKYIPDMQTISYVGKCTGVYPLALPSKELIGSRNTNEICILPFEYSCISYREYVSGLSSNSWILKELDNLTINYGRSIFSVAGDLVNGAIDSVTNYVDDSLNTISSYTSDTISDLF